MVKLENTKKIEQRLRSKKWLEKSGSAKNSKQKPVHIKLRILSIAHKKNWLID